MAEIEKIFPEYFQRFTLPEGAREESIKVYRACRSGKCDKDSFMPTYEQNGFKLDTSIDEKDPSQYSLSTCERPKDIKRFASLMSDMQIPYKIAVGSTNPRHGLVQRTSERTNNKKSSHVDWWLYKDAMPYEEFKMIDDFDSYYQNSKKK